jgi:hypothetical protein
LISIPSTDERVDYVNDRIACLLQEAGCPICLGVGCTTADGPPLADNLRDIQTIFLDPVQCARNKYHRCSVSVFNGSDYFLVSVMDVLLRSVQYVVEHP